jgi:hypothetical protein
VNPAARTFAGQLAGLSPQQALRACVKRFPWLKAHRGVLSMALDLQGRLSPQPNAYFRWHLPRWVSTLDVLKRAGCPQDVRQIVDLAAYAPFTLLLDRWLRENGRCGGETVFTYQHEAPTAMDLDGVPVPLVGRQLDLGCMPFPWEDGALDLVVLTEVIEHLQAHPQGVVAEANRMTKLGGYILVTTPNVASWKKLYMASNGDWSFDSPTFAGHWGHRYEYSNYQVHEMLRRCGYAPVLRTTRDVYFDDPARLRQGLQFWALALAKALTGDVAGFCRFLIRRGSTSFFVYRKVRHAASERSELVSI